ncbi:MAG: MFS transporter [Chloroflexi bacterium]|nr:MFS transporter [Chloroflexota bacterium]
MVNQLKKRAIRAWTMYDWANSAFVTTIGAAILPIYFSEYIKLDDALASWGLLVSIGSLIVAVISPVLGAIADFKGAKKSFLAIFVALGVVSTALLYIVDQPDEWRLAALFYILGTIGFAGSIVFYDSLLPHVAEPDEMDQVSSRGYALGYIGGGLLLLINVAMIFIGPRFLPNMEENEAIKLMMRLSLASVAVWWAVFSIPIFRHVPEPVRKIEKGEAGMNVVAVGFSRFFNSLKDIRKFRDLFMFLLAFFIYANGIGTIIYMAVAFGNDLGFGSMVLIGTLLMVQFVGAPFALLFGILPKKIGLKNSIYLSLVVYTLISILGYFLSKEIHFVLLGLGVASVQGGSQALSRSLIGKLMPNSKSAEFYGFFSVSEKFNSIIGPALFSVITLITGNGRLAILSLIVFFVVGMIVLTQVNVDRGIATAQAEDAKMVLAD